MENKSMTAAEWLFEQIARRQGSILHTIPFYNENQDLLLEAKQIDKEQRIQDMSKMQIISDIDFDGDVTFMFNPKKYYAETYGKTFIDLVSDEESQVHEVVRKLKENKIQGGNK
jgi:hypothetical protein